MIYKGMFLAQSLTDFYPDLLDARFVSRFAIYHQRYSTNTFPTWKLAQPFRVLAHNGEINTVSGNINWMRSHETRLSDPSLDPYMDDIKPVIQAGGSDTASLDNVFEVLTRAGRDAPMVKALMIPASIGQDATMPKAHRDLFLYCNAVMEPWDGPAAIAATDGRWVIAGLDRNGLRPLRYSISRQKLLVVGSETGMVKLDETDIVSKGRVGPGQTIGVDLDAARFYADDELKDVLAARQDFGEWGRGIVEIDSIVKTDAPEPWIYEGEQLRRRQLAVGFTMEDLEMILHPMVEDSAEAVGSMGDDTPLAVLSDQFRGLHHYFRQAFSQVTNPPIDSLRETRVMSLKTRLGNLGNVLDEDRSQCNLLQLESPVLSNAEFAAMRAMMGAAACEVDCTFPVADGETGLRAALDRIRAEAEEGVRAGATHVILSDERIGPDRCGIPMILATAGVHTHLVRSSLRTFTSLNVRASQGLDVHYFAVLIGVGATTVNAYLAQESIADRHRRGLFGSTSLKECVQHYKKAVDKGLLKVMSKMGISIVSSYRGGCNFEAIGLSRALVAEYFPGMQSRISGIGLLGIARKVMTLHAAAWDSDLAALPIGGVYKLRRRGETHAFDGNTIHMLQEAVASDSFQMYRRYTDMVRKGPPIALRDLLDFRMDGRKPIAVEEVESITEIRKRLISPGISLGALSPEAHETLSIAMNLDAGGNLDLDLAVLLDAALALAGVAGLFDDLAGAAAFGAGLGDVEEAAGDRDLAVPTAGRAGGDFAAGLGAGTMAGVAGLKLGDLDFLFHAAGGFLESDAHVVAKIGAAAATAALALAAAKGFAEDAVEYSAAIAAATEDFAEDLEGIVHAPSPAHAALRERLMAVAIVGGALVGAAEDFVGLAELLELFLGGVIAGIFVRMKFDRELAVRLFDFVRSRGAFHTQDVIIIPFRHLIFRSLGDEYRCGAK